MTRRSVNKNRNINYCEDSDSQENDDNEDDDEDEDDEDENDDNDDDDDEDDNNNNNNNNNNDDDMSDSDESSRRRHRSTTKSKSSSNKTTTTNKSSIEPAAAAATIAGDVETIEKVIKSRMGRVGATGSKTTVYNVDEFGDPNSVSNADAGADVPMESQYLIKWMGWSHLHNTWESRETLVQQQVKGIKKLENFLRNKEEARMS